MYWLSARLKAISKTGGTPRCGKSPCNDLARRGPVALTLVLIVLSASAQVVSFQGLKQLNGTQLYVKIIGKGEPILVVHGGPGLNQSYFFPHLNSLAKRYQLIFLDQRASGQSATPAPDSISLDFLVADMEALRSHLKLEKINILAHSWGAIPAVQYALDYPKRLNKMILCNPVALSTEYNPELTRLQQKRMTKKDSIDRVTLLNSASFKAGEAAAYKELLLLSFRHAFYRPANLAKLNIEIPGNYTWASRALFTGLGPDLSQYNYYPRLADCPTPVLIMHGAADVMPLKLQEQAKASFAKAFLLTFRNSGHFIFIEETERFRKEVIGFLSPRK